MVTNDPISPELEATAVHEAGHAVLQMALRLGVNAVTITPDPDAHTLGCSAHGGEYGHAAEHPGEEDDETFQLRLYAEDAFLLRHAIADYAGAEAVRQLLPAHPNPEAGAETDFTSATHRVNDLTDDKESIALYFKLAKRRCKVLVKHYAPEIEALAAELLSRRSLTGEEAKSVFSASMSARHAHRMGW